MYCLFTRFEEEERGAKKKEKKERQKKKGFVGYSHNPPVSLCGRHAGRFSPLTLGLTVVNSPNRAVVTSHDRWGLCLHGAHAPTTVNELLAIPLQAKRPQYGRVFPTN